MIKKIPLLALVSIASCAGNFKHSMLINVVNLTDSEVYIDKDITWDIYTPNQASVFESITLKDNSKNNYTFSDSNAFEVRLSNIKLNTVLGVKNCQPSSLSFKSKHPQKSASILIHQDLISSACIIDMIE